MTKVRRIYAFVLILAVSWGVSALGQRSETLQQVQSVYVGSVGDSEGARELRRELADVLRHGKRLRVVDAPEQADAVLIGKGDLWIRGYHSLSPRARANPVSAEPIYAGYLSIKVQGKDGETLWSYLANPKRVSFGELKHDLATQLAARLMEDLERGVGTTAAGATTGTAAGGGQGAAVQQLSGAGATFPFPIYQDWLGTFQAKHPAWRFTYKPIGSVAGLEKLAAGELDFAGSDIPPSASDTAAFPTVGGAVVLIYNLPRFGDDLRLTADVLANIFSGKIKMWNDPALRALNRRSPLPGVPITVVHRNDGSGMTFALTDYLAKTNASWKQSVGVGARVNWPVGQEASGNEGVAKLVETTPYALGYVEFIYAFDHHLSFASLRNAGGRFVQADLPSIAAAALSGMAHDRANEALGISIVNAPGEDAYPISTFSWLVFRKELESRKREAMLRFLEWTLTSGQRQCSALGYAPLPQSLVTRELAVLASIQ